LKENVHRGCWTREAVFAGWWGMLWRGANGGLVRCVKPGRGSQKNRAVAGPVASRLVGRRPAGCLADSRVRKHGTTHHDGSARGDKALGLPVAGVKWLLGRWGLGGSNRACRSIPNGFLCVIARSGVGRRVWWRWVRRCVVAKLGGPPLSGIYDPERTSSVAVAVWWVLARWVWLCSRMSAMVEPFGRVLSAVFVASQRWREICRCRVLAMNWQRDRWWQGRWDGKRVVVGDIARSVRG